MERRFCSHPAKVAVVGVGSVGASLAYSLTIHGLIKPWVKPWILSTVCLLCSLQE
jgi:glycine/D-amino acid oxidase-like deaminating enzyme